MRETLVSYIFLHLLFIILDYTAVYVPVTWVGSSIVYCRNIQNIPFQLRQIFMNYQPELKSNSKFKFPHLGSLICRYQLWSSVKPNDNDIRTSFYRYLLLDPTVIQIITQRQPSTTGANLDAVDVDAASFGIFIYFLNYTYRCISKWSCRHENDMKGMHEAYDHFTNRISPFKHSEILFHHHHH